MQTKPAVEDRRPASASRPPSAASPSTASLPDDHPFINHEVDKKGIGRIVEDCSVSYSTTQMAQILDELKRLGFHYATRAGVTVSVYDAMIPERSREILDAADVKVAKIEEPVRAAASSPARSVTVRSSRSGRAPPTTSATRWPTSFEKFNPIYMMAYSGARGNIKQIRQLAGMRGLMANPKGDIIDRPIKANFREGLTVLEYFISTHGARKGLADTALRTADSGYLTRRLVDVAQDVIVRESDCGTDEGVDVQAHSRTTASVDHNLVGRCLLEPAVNAETGEIVLRGRLLHPQRRRARSSSSMPASRRSWARTVMTCHAKHGICQACYGWDLASSRPVDIGTAVGIIAAQSIGEPGTQLTMRTFHTGGVAGEDITHGLPRVTELFEARKPKGQAILAEVAGKLTIEDGDKTRKLDDHRRRGHEKAYTVSRRATPASRASSTAPRSSSASSSPRVRSTRTTCSRLKGPNETLRYIVEQVQDVYRSQGVDINDKHIEVISRQMLRKVSVIEPGDTDFLPGQLVDRLDFAAANNDALADGGEPANGHPTLLGITKASLATDSYLSAASFQETTRVLTDAAIAGKEDHLLGLKENVIIGKLIPAATGMKRYRNVQAHLQGPAHRGRSRRPRARCPTGRPTSSRRSRRCCRSLPSRPSLSEADFESAFADLDLEDSDIDVSAFTGITFDPNAELLSRGRRGRDRGGRDVGRRGRLGDDAHRHRRVDPLGQQVRRGRHRERRRPEGQVGDRPARPSRRRPEGRRRGPGGPGSAPPVDPAASDASTGRSRRMPAGAPGCVLGRVPDRVRRVDTPGGVAFDRRHARLVEFPLVT